MEKYQIAPKWQQSKVKSFSMGHPVIKVQYGRLPSIQNITKLSEESKCKMAIHEISQKFQIFLKNLNSK